MGATLCSDSLDVEPEIVEGGNKKGQAAFITVSHVPTLETPAASDLKKTTDFNATEPTRLASPVTDHEEVSNPYHFANVNPIVNLIQKYGGFKFECSEYEGQSNSYRTIESAGSKYFGQVSAEGQKQGQGQLQDKYGLHMGYFNKDAKEGPGNSYFINSVFVAAEWKQNQLNGNCVSHDEELNQHSKNYYVNNMKEGYGEEMFNDGTSYKGNFKADLKHGMGEMRWPDGNWYKGEFKRGKIDGKGQFSWADGRVYEGSWSNDKMSGLGEMRYPDGRRYEGEFKDSLRDGKGVFYWSEGRRYEGGWCKGLQHGKGVIYDSAAGNTSGVWSFGTR